MYTVTILLFVTSFLHPILTEEESYKRKISVDHSYYHVHVYKHNNEGMYDRHLVDVEANGKVHNFLSNHSQAAEAVKPGFLFPFYGHNVDRFFITTHGFLSLAPRLHNLMYKTQYISPLRVKLDPSRKEEATVNYLTTDDTITVQWTNMPVQEKFKHPRGGDFTFQTTLYANGTIAFVYINIPEMLTSDALYDHEPAAGLSDAFLLGDSELHVYHTINIGPPDIITGTVAVFTPKPTCISQHTCQDCAKLREASEFACAWCADEQRCSDGADRLREKWDSQKCGEVNVTSSDMCVNKGHVEWRSANNNRQEKKPEAEPEVVEEESGSNIGVIISVVISVTLIVVLVGLGLTFVYLFGKNNPGGFAEAIALRLERNYKRFGGDSDEDQKALELGKTNSQEEEVKATNNNSITVSF